MLLVNPKGGSRCPRHCLSGKFYYDKQTGTLVLFTPKKSDTPKWGPPMFGGLPIFPLYIGVSIIFEWECPKMDGLSWKILFKQVIFQGTVDPPRLGTSHEIFAAAEVLYDPLSADFLVRILMFVVPLIRFLKLLRHWGATNIRVEHPFRCQGIIEHGQ